MKTINKAQVTAVCIDDFALKKRQRYGSVMVDLESHKVIDMIESREQNDVKKWLSEYPNIKIVSRDGSRTYANAITQAHPQAIQISDRFHLIKNLIDYATLALQKIFQSRIAIPITEKTQRCRAIMLVGSVAQQVALIKELHKKGHSQDEIRLITSASEYTVKKYLQIRKEDIPVEKQTARGREHIEAVEKLQKRSELARTLHNEGLSLAQISKRTGFTYNTIRNYISGSFSPVNAHYGKQREGKLEPFRSEVLQLRLEGLKYREIHDIIKVKGYNGTQDAIRGFVTKERRIHQDLLSTGAGTEELIDKKWLIRLLYKPIDDVKGITKKQLEYVCSEYPLYQEILNIVKEFKSILKSKMPEKLFDWIEKVSILGVIELISFAEGLRLDVDAVKNAITYDYNNGLAEGTINKIKLIKRIMYGRCHFSLLKNKCIFMAWLQ